MVAVSVVGLGVGLPLTVLGGALVVVFLVGAAVATVPGLALAGVALAGDGGGPWRTRPGEVKRGQRRGGRARGHPLGTRGVGRQHQPEQAECRQNTDRTRFHVAAPEGWDWPAVAPSGCLSCIVRRNVVPSIPRT